jgi:preprotein translocase subunit YajC
MQAQDLVFFAFAGVAAWLLLVRPQRARARALQEVRDALADGSRVMTTAGLHATVAALEGDTVRLEIAPGVRARFAASAVVRVLTDEPVGDAPAVPEQGEPPAD